MGYTVLEKVTSMESVQLMLPEVMNRRRIFNNAVPLPGYCVKDTLPPRMMLFADFTHADICSVFEIVYPFADIFESVVNVTCFPHNRMWS